MKEHEVARRTFGPKLKVVGPSFYIPPTFAIRPDFCKNFVTANSSHFYEFGTHRSKGRLKKTQGIELMLQRKKNIFWTKILLKIWWII